MVHYQRSRESTRRNPSDIPTFNAVAWKIESIALNLLSFFLTSCKAKRRVMKKMLAATKAPRWPLIAAALYRDGIKAFTTEFRISMRYGFHVSDALGLSVCATAMGHLAVTSTHDFEGTTGIARKA